MNIKAQRFFAAVLCVAVPMGGVRRRQGLQSRLRWRVPPDLKTGTDLKLFIESTQIRFAKDKKDV